MIIRKLKQLLASILLATIIFLGVKLYIFNHHSKPIIPKPIQEYKIDMNKIKIQNILNSNKLQALEITFILNATDTRYDKSKTQILNNLSKLLTTRKLTIESEYKAIFSYDLSKAQFIDKNGIYVIKLNADDIEVNLIQNNSPKTSETLSVIGRYYDSKAVAEILTQMQEIAKQKINTRDNYIKTLNNTETNLIQLFKNIGLDTNKIIIEKGI